MQYVDVVDTLRITAETVEQFCYCDSALGGLHQVLSIEHLGLMALNASILSRASSLAYGWAISS